MLTEDHKPEEAQDDKAIENAQDMIDSIDGTSTEPEEEQELPEETPETEDPVEEPEDQDEPLPETDEPDGEDPEQPEEKEEEKPESPLIGLASKYTQGEYKDEQEATAAIEEHIEDISESLNKNMKANEGLVNLFKENPEIVDLIHLTSKGAPLAEALPYITGDKDILTDLDDATEQEWAALLKDKAKQKKESEAAKAKITKNFESSMKNVEDYAQKNSIPKEKTSAFLEAVDDLVVKISNGVLEPDTIDRLYKGLYHDQEVKDKTQKAEIKGRNDAIDEIKRKTPKTDGVPHVKSGRVKAEDAKEDTPDDMLGRYADSFVDDRRF